MLNLKFENVYRNQRTWNIKIKFGKVKNIFVPGDVNLALGDVRYINTQWGFFFLDNRNFKKESSIKVLLFPQAQLCPNQELCYLVNQSPATRLGITARFRLMCVAALQWGYYNQETSHTFQSLSSPFWFGW